MRYICTIFVVLLFVNTSSAQLQRFIHQTFTLDSANTFTIDLYGAFVVEQWAGDALMIETQVSLSDASEGILNHFIKEGRYEIKAKLDGEILTLFSKDKERRPIKTAKGERKEAVILRIFVPELWQAAGENTWARPDALKKDFSAKGSG